ncbi:putative ABC multidrug transporter [Talaromyces proteolyticus]|uniref:ABC multidrug transporter n=1 Tax=Talaromyces proteolyticus TaxID=1131652 RepID=A0AAD4PYT1_9EURO|nr:putative ABC multidrug transporter [Talaromyces proteolyticus]KAH8694934.1 putative ABC multidrug transporter [Talaromyces proteolyticus]
MDGLAGANQYIFTPFFRSANRTSAVLAGENEHAPSFERSLWQTRTQHIASFIREGNVHLGLLVLSIFVFSLQILFHYRQRYWKKKNRPEDAELTYPVQLYTPLGYSLAQIAFVVASVAVSVASAVTQAASWKQSLLFGYIAVLYTSRFLWSTITHDRIYFHVNCIAGVVTLLAALQSFLPLVILESTHRLSPIQLAGLACLAATTLVPLVAPRPQRIPDNGSYGGEEDLRLVEKASVEETCSPISYYWTYEWITYLIFQAVRRDLVQDDLPILPSYDAPSKWAKKISIQRQRGGKILFVLCRLLAKDIQGIIEWAAITSFAEFLAPIGLVNLLRYLQNPSGAVVHPALWIALLFVGPATRSLCFQRYIFVATRSIVRIHMSLVQEIYRTAIHSLIYDSSISEKKVDQRADDVAEKEASKHRQADITTLMSSDVESIYNAREIFFVPVAFTISVTVALIFLYRLLGWPSFVGVATLFLSTPLPAIMSRRVSRIQRSVMRATDARISKITEYLGSIRTLKYFGWEPAMEKQIDALRQVEQGRIWKRNLITAIVTLSADFLPMTSLLVTFSTVALFTDTPLDAPTAFTSLSVMEILRSQCLWMANIVRTASQGVVSLRRLDRFFDSAVELKRHPEGPPEFKNATFRRTPIATFRMQDLSISFVENALNVVTGPTGSGKTSLLLSLIGETILESGIATCPRDVAYVPQTAWLQNESVKQNILFYSAFDQNRYDAVVAACGLLTDLEQLPDGDSTVVGERGTSLSGGQKQRVSLARAIYSPASTLLLDDIFSALDTHTTAFVYDQCFRRGLLAGRTVILVTHLPSALQDARTVITVEQGTVSSIQVNEESTLSSSSASTISGVPIAPSSSGVTIAYEDEIDLVKTSQSDAEDDSDVSSDQKPATSSRLVAEQSSTGRIPRTLVLEYLLNFGGYPFLIVAMFSTLAVQITYFSITYWLSVWADAYDGSDARSINVHFYLSVYATTIVAYLSFQFCNIVFFQAGGWRASKKMHTRLLHAILYAPVSWYDQNPIGRALNRFGNDTRSLDAVLPDWVQRVVDSALRFLMRIVSISLVIPIFAVPACVICGIGYVIGELYTRAQICIRRLVSVNASPIFIHFTDTIAGMSVIRARSGMDSRFQQLLAEKVGVYARSKEAQLNSNRWVSVRSDLSAATVTAIAGVLAYTSNGDPGLVGFSLSNAVGLGQAILILVRTMNELEVELNSFQRVEEYAGIEPEEADNTKDQKTSSPRQLPPAHWPTSGHVEFRNVTARYHNGPNVLHDISFVAHPGERIGIVGRTGSGKSTLGLSLLRFTDLVSGSISIDGVDVSTIPLNRLRTSIALIPQDPVLFSGDVQSNLDPFGELGDTELQAALSACCTSIHITAAPGDEERVSQTEALKLDTPVAANGENFSQGQRQVLGLARAVSRRAKVVLLDEATASVDQETDEHIQRLIRSEFPDSTIIAIAHRLRTIVDYDRVIVMGGGEVLETGTPVELIEQKGVFCDMLRSTGEYEELVRIVEHK